MCVSVRVGVSVHMCASVCAAHVCVDAFVCLCMHASVRVHVCECPSACECAHVCIGVCALRARVCVSMWCLLYPSAL